MFARHLTPKVIESLSFFPAVALIGSRQVGKTTLAKHLQTVLEKPCLYLDLERESDLAKLNAPEIFLSQYQEHCIIIDEIQQMPSLFPLLRALIDEHRVPARFLLLGSASPDLIRNSAESLAGRIAYHELTPFSYSEVSKNVTWQAHWFRGGFPLALLAPKPNFATQWLDQFIETFVERDLRRLHYEVPTNTLKRLLQMSASLHGNLLNMADLARSFGISQSSIVRYLDLLEGGFLINRLQPFFQNTGKRLIKTPKIYIRDSGMLHTLARIADLEALQGHFLVGASWEGYVVEEIRRVLGRSAEMYFYRTSAGAEMDVVILLPNGKKICIEAKYNTAPKVTKGFHEALRDLQPDHTFIVVPSPPETSPYLWQSDVTVCPLAHLLQELQNENA